MFIFTHLSVNYVTDDTSFSPLQRFIDLSFIFRALSGGITIWPLDYIQGWGQLHNINSNSNSNSRGFNSNSNSNSGQSPEYQLQLQLQLRRFQLQLQFQLRQISRISTPTPTPTPTPEVSTPTPIPTPEISTPIPTPTPEFQIQPQLHFKSNQSCSIKLPLPNYNVKHCMNQMEVCCRYSRPRTWP